MRSKWNTSWCHLLGHKRPSVHKKNLFCWAIRIFHSAIRVFHWARRKSGWATSSYGWSSSAITAFHPLWILLWPVCFGQKHFSSVHNDFQFGHKSFSSVHNDFQLGHKLLWLNLTYGRKDAYGRADDTS